jgi:hypothetical protein
MDTGVDLHPDFGSSFGHGPNYGIPITVVKHSHRRVRVHFQYASESDKVRYPLGKDTRIEGGSDRHAIVVDKGTCKLFETFATRKKNGKWHAGSGAVWSLESDKLRPNGWTSADAAGLPILPGLLRWNEVKHHDIDHAIRFTTPVTSSHHLWPARHDAGSTRTWSYPPMGARFRLRASYHPTGFGPDAMAVVDAMKKYGLVLADNGSPWYFQGERNSHWPNRLLDQLKEIPAKKFVAVDTSSLKPSGKSSSKSSSKSPAKASTDRGTASRRSGRPDWFTTPSGKKQLIVSAEDWGLLANAGLDHHGNWKRTFNDYFATRKKQGYNAVEVSLFGYPDLSGGSQGGDWDGTLPFASGTNPTSSPNPAFWARRDYFLKSAKRHGFRVFLNVTTPNLGRGVFSASWSKSQWAALGRLLAHRYGSRRNIMWMVGDDYYGTVDPGLNALRKALRAGGAHQPMSIQNFQESTSRRDLYRRDPTATPWGRKHAQFNWVYTYNVSYDGVEKAALERHPIPYMYADGFFLASGTDGSVSDTDMMRHMIWWALSSSSKGFEVGDNEVWPWDSHALSVVKHKQFYRKQVPAIASTFRHLRGWQHLEPDTASRLVIAGRGKHAHAIRRGGAGYISNTDSYVSASRTPSGSLAVIYMSHPSKITIDPHRLKPGYVATWVDPANGSRTRVASKSTYNSGSRGRNSAGDVDWVLVLKAPRR